MNRSVIGNPFDNQLPSVDGTAQVVDTYNRVTADTARWDALNQSLQALTGKAQRALSAEEQRAADQEFRPGQELYNQTRLNMGDAVREGIVPEGASPFIRKGYRASLMGTLATRYANELDNALTSQRLYTSGDPRRIETFIADFQTKFMDDNGLSDFNPSEVAQYFGNDANNANERFRGAWQQRHISWQADQAYRAMESNIASVTAGLFHAGMTEEERAGAMGELKTWLETQAASAATDGMDNRRVTATVLQAVGIAAELTGDPEILDVFIETSFGTAAIASSLDNQAKILAMRSSILSNQAAATRSMEAAHDNAMEDLRGSAGADLFRMTTNPAELNRDDANVILDRLIATGDEKNIDEAIKWRNILDNLETGLEGANKTPASELALDLELSRATTREEARDILSIAAEYGTITSSDISTKLNNWESTYAPETTGLDFFTSSTAEGTFVKNYMDAVGQQDEYDPVTVQNRAIAQRDYIRTFTEQVLLFREQNGREPTAIEKVEIDIKVTAHLNSLYVADPLTDFNINVPSIRSIYDTTSVPEF
jgi:hypothetical protein